MSVRTAVPRLAAAVMVVGLALLSANRAAAAPVPWPETGTAGDLVLATEPRYISFPAMSPDSVGYAALDMRLVDKPWATTSFVLETSGELMRHPSGLTLAVATCESPWSGLPSGSVPAGSSDPLCPSGARTVLPPTPGALFTDSALGSSVEWPAGTIRERAPGHLLLRLSLPAEGASDETLMGIAGNFVLRVTATGDENVVLPEEPEVLEPEEPGVPVVVAPGALPAPAGGHSGSPARGGDILASTGMAALGWLLLALGAVVLGATSIAAPRRRSS